MRLILDGVLYVLRTGCAWAHLPHDFPPPGTEHRWFLRRTHPVRHAFSALGDR
jgi:putative transposase